MKSQGENTAKVYLRSLELDDLNRTHRWHNDSELYESLLGTFRYVSLTADEEWLRKSLHFSTQNILLAICSKKNKQHIGNVYLRDIDWVARKAELSIFIGETAKRSQGYGRETLELVFRHAFKDLGLRRLYLLVLEDNKHAIDLYQKCGFEIEGRLRQHSYKGGYFKDVLVMGVFIEKFFNND